MRVALWPVLTLSAFHGGMIASKALPELCYTYFSRWEDVGRMAKKQHYMTWEERIKLEAYLRAGRSIAWIAQQMEFSRQTIYNEIKRGRYECVKKIHGITQDTVEYSADKAQQIYEYRQTAKGGPLKIGQDRAYAEFLEQKIIQDRYSPAAAIAEAKKAGYTTSICVTTLYSYIDKEVFYYLGNKHLWEKAKRRPKAQRPERRLPRANRPSIEQRPEYIGDRQEPGHWEMDLVIGKGNTGPVLLTMTERVTRMEIITLLPDKKAATIRGAIDRMERQMGSRAFRDKFKSFTIDNGSEFGEHELLQKSARGKGIRFDVWYCHSYSSWEKGTVENHNRMIRRWFPKGTDFSKVTKKEVAAVQDWMNHYPRKVLNWGTPAEMAAQVWAA